MAHAIGIARVYDDPGEAQGKRVLVDRLWPRGLRKDDPRIGTWFPDAAPSTELRRWYGHRLEAFGEFAHRYRAELSEASDAVDHLSEMAAAGPLTLTTASKELEHSEAAVLAEVLRERG